jgi:hypothetical protein
LLSILITASLRAQNDAPVDSAVTITELADTTSMVEDQEDDNDDKDKTAYFLDKHLPGAGIDSPVFRKLGDSALSPMRSDEDFWYANTVFDKKKEKATEKNESFADGQLFQTLLWMLIIGGFIAFLVIYLSNSNAGLFRRSRSVHDTVADPETDDIFAIQYAKEIEKAISAGNFRLAVRLLFLKTLRSLSDKHLIQYTQDRTNFDYLLQVQHASWYNLFFRLTRNYEYVWYGQFAIDREKFDMIHTEFTHLEQQLPSL